MSLAYFPMFPDDFEADTAHLTLAEDGAYNRLLRLCWRTHGCSVPNERAWIYRRMRAHSDNDQAVIDTIIEEFFEVSEGRLRNARIHKEYEKATEAHSRRVLAGSKGGKTKALKTKDEDPSKPTELPKQCFSNQNQNQNIDDGDEQALDSTIRKSEVASWREQILEAIGVDCSASPNHSSHGATLGSAPDMYEADRWSKELGLTHSEIIDTITDTMSRKRGGPPHSFSYFTPEMRRLSAAKAAPRLQPFERGSYEPSSGVDGLRQVGCNGAHAKLLRGFQMAADRFESD